MLECVGNIEKELYCQVFVKEEKLFFWVKGWGQLYFLFEDEFVD